MEVKASEQTRPLKEILCGELLVRLKGTDPKNSLNTEFHREFCLRFEKFLYKCCTIVCSNHGASVDIADDIFQETIIKALKKIHLFNYDPSEPDPIIVKRICGWLGKIANYTLIDFLENNCKEEKVNESMMEEIVDEVSFDSFDENSHIGISFGRLRLQEALATLSERERYIIMVFANYDCLNLAHLSNTDNETDSKVKEKHLPNEVITQLTSDLNVTKGNLRILKNRAIKKILAYLSVAA